MKVDFRFIDHEIGVDFYLSKRKLFEAFYGDFYDFIKKSTEGREDLKLHKISDKNDFYRFADWYADGMEHCYGIGFGFHKYFLTVDEGGRIEDQPENTFIGYCVKQGKYHDFFNFLVTFFAWWRNDEGCTSFNPYNRGDDFFVSSWAALVDTSKLFLFTAETVFGWQSFRVKYALDNIPGVILNGLSEEELLSGKIYDPKAYPNGNLQAELPRLRVAGYEFNGWFDEAGQEIKTIKVDSEQCLTVYGRFERKDLYQYWEKEFPLIGKKIKKRYKKPDPA